MNCIDDALEIVDGSNRITHYDNNDNWSVSFTDDDYTFGGGYFCSVDGIAYNIEDGANDSYSKYTFTIK